MLRWLTKSRSEMRVRDNFKEIIQHCSNLDNGGDSSLLIVDVGSNLGVYGIVGALAGCETILFEPQITCQTHIKQAIVSNGVEYKAFLIPRPVGLSRMSMRLNHTLPCNGRFPISEMEKGRYNSTYLPHSVEFIELDRFFGPYQNILWLKIDTEGHESFALQGAMELFKSHRIYQAVV